MKKKLLAVIALAGIAIALVSYKFYHRSAAMNVSAVMVKVSTVEEASIPQEIHAIATLTARSVEITPEIAGHVNAVLFQDGAKVAKGDVLVQLDDAVYKTKYESAKARLHLSENNFSRMTQLGKKGIIAQQTIDEVESNLKERKSEQQENEVMLNKMKLTAPFAGVVGRSQVNPGNYVNVGQSIVLLTDTRHLRIEYTVPEKYLPHLKMGQEVKVTTSAYPDKFFVGKLTFISPTINADNRSIALYAEIDNSEDLLAPGMYVDASQSLGTTEHALMVPARSLVPILDGAQVFKVVDGKAFSVDVVIGQRTTEKVQVTQGVSKGDVIITDGQMKVKNGMPVQIQS
jgi:membrane fusion protein (multidrug efflux system)